MTLVTRTPIAARLAFRRWRGRRGVMLVLTLWMAVVLTILATSLTSHLIMQTRLMSMRRHRIVADSLARAGVAKAIADLKNDLLLGAAEGCEGCNFDAEGDIWKRPEEGKVDQKLGQGTFTVDVTDEESKIHLNSPQANVAVLSALLEQLGYEEEDAKIAAAAIVDWKDFDDRSSIEGATDRREGEVYALLMMGDAPTDRMPKDMPDLRIKNDFFITTDELLSVYGITPDIYYGPGTPEAEEAWVEMADQFAYLKQRGREFKISKRRSRRKDEQPVGLRDCVTVFSNATLNINTAGREVLAAVLFASGVSTAEPETLADRIIDYRRDGRDDDIDNNRAFRRSEDLAAMGDIGEQAERIGTAYTVGFNSENFTITSIGSSLQYSRTIRLVVNRRLITFQKDERFEEWERDRDRRYEAGSLRSSDEERRSKKLGPDEATIIFPSVKLLQWLQP